MCKQYGLLAFGIKERAREVIGDKAMAIRKTAISEVGCSAHAVYDAVRTKGLSFEFRTNGEWVSSNELDENDTILALSRMTKELVA